MAALAGAWPWAVLSSRTFQGRSVGVQTSSGRPDRCSHLALFPTYRSPRLPVVRLPGMRRWQACTAGPACTLFQDRSRGGEGCGGEGRRREREREGGHVRARRQSGTCKRLEGSRQEQKKGETLAELGRAEV